MGKNKILTSQHDEIVKLYKSGLSAGKIADQYGVGRTTIFYILRKNGITGEDRPTPFNTYKTEMCEMYLSGQTVEEIASFYGVSDNALSHRFDQWGVERRHRKYKLNEHYFDDIDTPNKAYILGMLYADGYNNVKERLVRLKLQERDKDLLESIRNEVESERPLQLVEYNKYNANWQDAYALFFGSVWMCKALAEKGVVQNKSLILQWPTFLPNHLYSHFLRGYIDGDGHIPKRKSDYRVELVSSIWFCQGVEQYLEQELNIKCQIRDACCKNDITKVVWVSGKEQSKRFLDWIYQDSDLKLERKYNTYISKYYS